MAGSFWTSRKGSAHRGLSALCGRCFRRPRPASIGRGAAHDILHEAIVISRTTGKPVDEILLRQPEFRNNMAKETLNNLLDPEKNIGQSVRIARQVAAKARERTSQFK